MDSHNGLEALVQRGRSPLFLDLISVYQEAFDALREAPGASYNTIVSALRNQTKFPDKLKGVILRHTGFVIEHVKFVDELLPNMMAVIDTVLSQPSPQHPAWTHGMAATAVRSFYDDRQGRLHRPIGKTLNCRMNLFIAIGFWQMRNPDGSYIYTPAEAAAISLHELGHFDHEIRTFLRVENTLADAADIVRYVQQMPDPETIQLILNRLTGSVYLDKQWRKVLQTTKTYFAANPDSTDPVYLDAVNTLAMLIEADLSGMLLPTYTVAIYRGQLRQAEVLTDRHKTETERSADEFASRNGAYAELASFLAKAHAVEAKDNAVWVALLLPERVGQVVSSLLSFASYFDLSPEYISDGYDALTRRMGLLIETAKHAFSDKHLPDDVKTDLKQQIADCEKYLKSYTDSSHHKVRLAFKTWLTRVGTIGAILKTPLQDRLSIDYGHLQEATRSLSRNPLSYLAHK